MNIIINNFKWYFPIPFFRIYLLKKAIKFMLLSKKIYASWHSKKISFISEKGRMVMPVWLVEDIYGEKK